MLTLATESLAGGQGKTTVALLTARYLAKRHHSVLVVDADPQSSLTTFCGHQVQQQHPTLLEVLRGEVQTADGIYPTETPNLFLIPSDGGLDKVQDYLASSGCGAFLLQQQLEAVANAFDFCFIDAPPQRSQLCLTTLGAANAVVLPMEASVKGYASLERTLELLELVRKNRVFRGQFLGVMPFKDKWVGLYQTKHSRRSIEAMAERVGASYLLPTIRDVEPYKTAINQKQTLSDLGYPDLEYPFEVLSQKLFELIKPSQESKTVPKEATHVK